MLPYSMAWTITNVFADAFRVRYRIVADSTGFSDVNITAAGSATPDIVTDAPQGSPLRAFFEAIDSDDASIMADLFDSGHLEVKIQDTTITTEKITSSPSFNAVVFTTGGKPEFILSVDITNSTGYIDFIYRHSLPG